MNEKEILQKMKETYQDILQEKLVGIYIHGSLAFHCFNWDKSDIDFLVVVNQPLVLTEKEALISVLLELDPYCPPKGLEMSVVLNKVCKPFVYPTPFELHFSNQHKEKCKADLKDYCEKMNGTDVDLAAHFTVIREVGQILCGKAINEVFAEVPKEYYIDSIRSDIADVKECIETNPVYYVLNLCRVLAYLEDGVVLSKRQGGEWGIMNCPAEFRDVVEHALEAYEGKVSYEEEKEELLKFADVMLERIFGSNT